MTLSVPVAVTSLGDSSSISVCQRSLSQSSNIKRGFDMNSDKYKVMLMYEMRNWNMTLLLLVYDDYYYHAGVWALARPLERLECV
ncbi:hypothetical protein PoB_004455700 [Plakobranchus ocellatus]|uniref:Uncharacterized protein n=1 Tax=Plakobranchus ocellatus TaxID=259542 RepID=A0AAV4BF40_9GAST|nr:hypothetical protein PoB_004455700 [Plakobranchus ocellatus]